MEIPTDGPPTNALRAGARLLTKRLMLAPLVGAVVATSSVSAAAPPDKMCGDDPSAAQRFRSAGNLTAARARLTACVSTGCLRELQECARQLAAIDAEMPSIVVEARDEGSNYVSEAHATMDGAPLLDRLDGKEILVNPGEHFLTLDAAGFRKAETTFVAYERQKRLRVVVFLSAAPSRALPSPVPNPQVSRAASPPRGDDETPGLSKGRKVGLALGGAGLGALAVGTIWSLMSKATYDHALASECGGDPNHCSAQGIADGRTARSEAAISTLGFVGAGALLAMGAVFYVTSPRHDVAVAPAVDYAGGGLTVVGKW